MPTTKEIFARRKAGNLYDVTYSDDTAEDKELNWRAIVAIARRDGYGCVRINNSAHRADDEPKQFTVDAKNLDPVGWTHLLLEQEK